MSDNKGNFKLFTIT